MQTLGPIDKGIQPHEYNFIFVTDGPSDIQKFLFPELSRSQIPVPNYFDRWIDLKRVMKTHFSSKSKKKMRERWNLQGMLKNFGLSYEGRLHSGIDDTR